MRIRVLLSAVLMLPAPVFSQLLINEVQTANMATIADSEGDFEDWFELYNNGPDPVNLAGYGISDDPAEPAKWLFPGITVPPQGHVFVWASGEDTGGGGNHYETAVFPSDTWSYLVPDTEPDGAWRSTGFDDSGWNTGTGGFGYADGDDGTTIVAPYSVYMRRTFTLENAAQVQALVLHMDYDDGFVAYLNGVEIARAGIGTEGIPPAWNDLSSGHEANGYQGIPVDAWTPDAVVWAGALQAGENVLAVQVHNSDPGSSDMTGNAWLTLAFPTGISEFPDAPEWMGFNQATDMHTSFSLASGETLVLTDADGNVADQRWLPQTAIGHSYARMSSGDPDWCFAPEPTPGAANNNTLCAISYEPKPLFNIQSGIFQNAQVIELSSVSPTAVIRYTTDGSIPDETSALYTGPIALDTTATIAARCFSTGSLLPSFTEKNTYMIDELFLTLPVISISTDPANLWDYNTGIYVLGPPDYGGYPYFGSNIWEDWEKESYAEYFDYDGVLQWEGPVGLKIHGGWSRALDQKSLRIICRDDYGMDEIDYPLIPDKPYIDSFKSFNLRNGGNDYFGPRYHDALMQRAMRSTEVDYMGYTPVLTFLNGEYWGMYELRENLNEHFCEDNSGVPADKCTVISYNYMGWNVINGNDDSFYTMLDYIVNADPLSDTYYETASTFLDMENYMDYIIAETYYANGDWSNGYMNNTKFWHNDEPGGKWRFMLMDLDFGMGEWPCVDYIVRAGDDWFETDQLFANLKQNAEFRKRFVMRYYDLVNTVFQTENFTALRDQMRNELNAAMPRHCQRWGTDYNGWYYGYDGRLNWNNERLACIDDVIQSHFGLNNLLQVTLDVEPAGAGRIHISTVEPSEDEYPWTGTYVNGIPVQVTAIANPGYRFEYWEANDLFPVNASIKQFVLNLEQDITFRAYFSGESAADAVRISEFMYNPGSTDTSGDWVEIHNPLEVPLDLSSMEFKDQNYFNDFQIPLNTVIPPGGYLVLAEEPEAFMAQYPEVDAVTGPWDFELNDDNDVLNLYFADGAEALSIAYSDDSPWPAGSDGTGRSVEFDTLETDLQNPLNWFAGCIGGSPGSAYDLLCGITSVEDEEAPDFLVYPNPAEEFVTVVFPEANLLPAIELFAADGRRVAQWRVPAGSTMAVFDITALAPGVYSLAAAGSGLKGVRLVVR